MGNSVIYRPAYDAEVEYLESDGNSYIDTGLKASSELGILAHIYVTGIFPFGGRNGLTNKEFSFCAMDNRDSGFRFGSSAAIAQGRRLNELYEFDNTQNHNILKVGNTSYVATYNSFISDYNVFLFGLNNAGATGNNSSRIYDFKIYNNSTLVRDYIPVRIGSTGYMYDKVSKQLFANKGTGNFILGNDVSNVVPQQRCVLYFGSQRSVVYERIYEEYEWLVGDGSAWIDTNTIIPNEKVSVSTRIINTSNSYTTNYHCVPFSNRTANVIQPMVVIIQRRDLSQLFNDIENPRQTISYSVGDVIAISTTTYRAQNGRGNLKLFYTNDMNFSVIPWDGKISNFEVESLESAFKISLIPCKLLQSIPAILDGNGIARQAGECGMWDKVSNKFYGNVANSGTFTVKGPKCYEEYDWLEVEVSSSENITMMQLPVNSYEFSFIRKWDRYNIVPHSTYFISTLNNTNYSYFTNTNYSALIWDGRSTVYTSIKKYSYGGSVSINCDSQNYYIDGESVPIYGECSVIRIDSVIDNPSMVSNVAFSTSAITVDDSVRYVPCKLTHGIPASMDANGIARPAGTCGMWDKVNDKFYGNVANSGTFTVSND